MFGLEKKGKALFEFDLEKELKSNPSKAKELIKTVESQIQEIKNILRQGTESEDFDKFGMLLHGYAALQKILTKLSFKK
jgi:hypothetical protein